MKVACEVSNAILCSTCFKMNNLGLYELEAGLGEILSVVRELLNTTNPPSVIA